MQIHATVLTLALAATAAAQATSNGNTVTYWTGTNCTGNEFLHATNDSSNTCEPLEKNIRSAAVFSVWPGHSLTLYTDVNCNSAPISFIDGACHNGTFAAYRVRTV